jgi:peroxiredoxin
MKLPMRTFMGLDGKKHTLAGLADGKPVFLVYLDDDPAMKRGARDMNRLSKQLNGRIRVMGIYPDILANTRKFVRKYGIQFPVLCNPEWAGPPASNWLALIGERYGTNILTTALVLPDRRVLGTFGGYSRAPLLEMFQKLRKAGGAKISISLRAYPKNVVEGRSVIYGLTPP